MSPDGRRLVLADPVDVAGTGMLIVDLVAGTTRKIDITGGISQPAWSPDGLRIAYRGFTIAGPFQKETGIWVVSAAGGPPQQVWTSDRQAGTGATWVHGWTEDGAGIAISRDFKEISVVDVATGTVTVAGGAIQSAGAAWRAKHPSVAIIFDDGGVNVAARIGHLEVRDTTLGPARVVARYGPGEGSFLMAPQWNPRGDEILMQWACGEGVIGREEVVIVDGVSGRRRAVATKGCVYSASWNGVGTKILYSDIQSLRVMSSDGSNDRELWRPGLPPGAFQQNIGAITPFAPR